MRGSILAVGLMLAAGLARLTNAHEGHEHKAMGTVAALSAEQIEVEIADGKKVAVQLTKSTQFKRGKAKAATADVKLDERVVVVYVEEKGSKVARQVLLGSAPPAGTMKPKN
jgi:hypothetical protein